MGGSGRLQGAVALHRDDLRVVGFALRPTAFSDTALCGSVGSVALRPALSNRVTESEVGFALRPISVALNYLRVVIPIRIVLNSEDYNTR